MDFTNFVCKYKPGNFPAYKNTFKFTGTLKLFKMRHEYIPGGEALLIFKITEPRARLLNTLPFSLLLGTCVLFGNIQFPIE